MSQGNLIYTSIPQAYAHVTGGNPLKGFIPYKGDYHTIPYSMEWWYLPFSSLMPDKDTFTFEDSLEPVLNEIASRGHQAVFRVYLDYPNKKEDVPAIPQFIWDMGVEKIEYFRGFEGGVMPDYTDQRLIDVLDQFIREMGRRYDGDPRIGYITCGLIGHWGEWHTYMNYEKNMPSDAQQNQLFKAFEEAFSTTKVLARYPASADAASMNIGYHDDSFTESTIASTRGFPEWYFMGRMIKAKATEKWKTVNIGGEFRPEGQRPFLNGGKPEEYYQDYEKCVLQTHCTWLMMQASFNDGLTEEQLARAQEGSDMLGYELHVASADVKDGILSLVMENRGVAPFYYNWKVRLGLVQKGKLAAEFDTPWQLTKCLPGEPAEYQMAIPVEKIPEGDCTLVLSAENPLENGVPLRFANESQDQDLPGWVTLGRLAVK